MEHLVDDAANGRRTVNAAPAHSSRLADTHTKIQRDITKGLLDFSLECY